MKDGFGRYAMLATFLMTGLTACKAEDCDGHDMLTRGRAQEAQDARTAAAEVVEVEELPTMVEVEILPTMVECASPPTGSEATQSIPLESCRPHSAPGPIDPDPPGPGGACDHGFHRELGSPGPVHQRGPSAPGKAGPGSNGPR